MIRSNSTFEPALVVRVMRWRSALIVALCAVLLGAMPAVARTPHVLRWADGEDVTSLNTLLATSGNIGPLSELTMAEFTRFDAHGNPVAELVTEIPTKANHGVSPDGKVVTWHLRHGVRWSDGAPFDASDVTYTFRVATDPRNDIALRDVWTRLARVDAPDRYTVVFHFKAPYALFVENYFATNSSTCILPRHVLGPDTQINDAPYNALPIGIGPFRYTAYHRDENVEMEANPYYWRGAPKLARVVYEITTDENTLFTQLETGELDFWDVINGALAQRVMTLPGKAYQARATSYIETLAFNVERPALRDPTVRRALALALDRETILAKAALGHGVTVQSVVPSMAEGYLAMPVVHDADRAAALLDAAGWKRGTNGVRTRDGAPFSIDLALPAGNPARATEATLIQSAWQAIGIDVTIHPWSEPRYFAPAAAGGVLMSAAFDVAIFASSIGPLYANIDGSYDCESATPHGFNISRYCNPALDALNDRYLRSFDANQRRAIAAAMQHAIDRDAPVVPLYYRSFLAAYDAHLRGYHPSAFSYWGDPLDLDL